MHLRGKRAERLVLAYLIADGWPEIHQARASVYARDGVVRTASNDLFGCFDFLATGPPSTWAIQVTTPAAVSARKRKIAGRYWDESWGVSVATVEVEGEEVTFSFYDLNLQSGRWVAPREKRHAAAKLMAALREREGAERATKRRGADWTAALKEAKRRTES